MLAELKKHDFNPHCTRRGLHQTGQHALARFPKHTTSHRARLYNALTDDVRINMEFAALDSADEVFTSAHIKGAEGPGGVRSRDRRCRSFVASFHPTLMLRYCLVLSTCLGMVPLTFQRTLSVQKQELPAKKPRPFAAPTMLPASLRTSLCTQAMICSLMDMLQCLGRGVTRLFPCNTLMPYCDNCTHISNNPSSSAKFVGTAGGYTRTFMEMYRHGSIRNACRCKMRNINMHGLDAGLRDM